MDRAPTRATLVEMSEDRLQNDNPRDPDKEGDDRPASTPFDNPFFLPVLLWAFAAYFGYDIVTDAEAYQNYPLFNQGGFALLSALAIYFTWSAIKEKRAERDKSSD
ncbi:MAG: hypothetical protein IH827_02900 [Myxococcales bacterium]|nr:hypothetical protein [Myxococcales bacterium]